MNNATSRAALAALLSAAAAEPRISPAISATELHARAAGARRARHLPLRHVRRRGVLGRRHRPAPRPSPAPPMAASGPGVSPETALAVGLKVDVDALPRSLQRALARGKVDLDRPGDHARAAQARCGVGVTGFFDEQGTHHLDGHPVRALPLDRRRFVRAGHRPPARRLGQPRSQRRRHRRARAAARAGGAAARHRRGDGAHRAELLGTRAIRRGAVPRRQGLPARRQIRRGADSAGLRPRGREPAHLDRLGRRLALECVRRESRDARPGHVLRSAARRRDDASRSRRANGFGHVRAEEDLHHAAAAGAAALSARRCRRRSRRAAATTARPRSAARTLFNGKANCGSCHVPPLYTEPGWNMHTGAEIGIDEFQAAARRTSAIAPRRCAACGRTPRAASTTTAASRRSAAVIDHYDAHFSLGLSSRREERSRANS